MALESKIPISLAFHRSGTGVHGLLFFTRQFAPPLLLSDSVSRLQRDCCSEPDSPFHYYGSNGGKSFLETKDLVDLHQQITERLFVYARISVIVVWLHKGKPPDDLEVAFNPFLAKVEEYWLQPPAKEPNTPLGSAYYSFWKTFNEQAQV